MQTSLRATAQASGSEKPGAGKPLGAPGQPAVWSGQKSCGLSRAQAETSTMSRFPNSALPKQNIKNKHLH